MFSGLKRKESSNELPVEPVQNRYFSRLSSKYSSTAKIYSRFLILTRTSAGLGMAAMCAARTAGAWGVAKHMRGTRMGPPTAATVAVRRTNRHINSIVASRTIGVSNSRGVVGSMGKRNRSGGGRRHGTGRSCSRCRRARSSSAVRV